MATSHAVVFAQLRNHLGQAVHLNARERLSGMYEGPYPLTVFDYLALDDDTQEVFLEEKLYVLATKMVAARGSGWSTASLIPFAVVGGDTHPVPVDELSQQIDGVLLLDVANGEAGDCPVFYCVDPSIDKLQNLGMLSALGISRSK